MASRLTNALCVLAAVLLVAIFSVVAVLAQTLSAADKLKVIQELIRRESKHSLTKEEINEIGECLLARGFEKIVLPKGTNLQEDFLMKSCFAKDPHARYLPPQKAEEAREQRRGHFEGVGLELKANPAGAEITRIIPGGPADKGKNLKIGDLVIAIGKNEQELSPLKGLSLSAIVSLIRGPSGTDVFLKIVRKNSTPFTVLIKRGRVDLIFVEAKEFPLGIGYLKIHSFNKMRMTLDDIYPKLAEFSRRGISQLIIDLRDNTGGLLSESIRLFYHFAPADEEIILEGRGRNDALLFYFATPQSGPFSYMRVAVLINEYSASASEITAGVLKSWGAKVFGSKSYGKGSVQTQATLDDGSIFIFTIAYYHFSDGKTLDGTGIIPDIKVKDDPATKDKDEVLEAALNYLRAN